MRGMIRGCMRGIMIGSKRVCCLEGEAKAVDAVKYWL